MLHFIYTYSEYTPHDGHTRKTVRIYRLVRGKPSLVGQNTDTFVSEFQLVMETMEALKLLPIRAFERHPENNSMVYCYPALLEEAGIATVCRVT